MPNAVLQAAGLTKRYRRQGRGDIAAVEDVSFSIMPGECVGLVGGSGCGKSTVARMVTLLTRPTAGSIVLNGVDVTRARGAARRATARDVQMVFQDPASSFDPRRTLGQGACEALRNFGMPAAQARERCAELFERCGLPPELADRYPREVSGGQCQRAAIARALAPGPSLVVCDEATSALDVTVQAQIVALLRDISREGAASYLFICHDLALVQGFCDRVLVMQAGRIVEQGPTAEVIARPSHPCTRQLIDSVLDPRPAQGTRA